MCLDTAKGLRLGIASYSDPGQNIVSQTGAYALWVDSLPVPQAGFLWRVHATLGQMFSVTNNQAGVGGLFLCAPGTPNPPIPDMSGEVGVMGGAVRVDRFVWTNGSSAIQLFQKGIAALPINGKNMGGYVECPTIDRDIIVPPQHFLRFLVNFGGTVPALGNWFSLLNILYEPENC